MESYKRKLFQNSKGFKTTASIDADIKIIKKFNNLVAKLKRTGDLKYEKEIINICIMMNNIYHFSKMVDDTINMFIEEENQERFRKIYDKFQKTR